MKIIVKNLGPIEYAEMEIGKFTIITGCQSSGKSTLAKVAFLFSRVKDDIYSLIIERHIGKDSHRSLFSTLFSHIVLKLSSIFAIQKNDEFTVECQYNSGIKIVVNQGSHKNVIYSDQFGTFSDELIQKLDGYDKFIFEHSLLVQDHEKLLLINSLNQLFSDEYECIYIPAGRSIVSTLASQLALIYNSMKDEQKNTIDFCTRSYIEKILTIKPAFNDGLDEFIKSRRSSECSYWLEMAKLVNKILGGTYFYNNGHEILKITEQHGNTESIELNLASSGQQESLWILYLIFYYAYSGKQAFFIIEEPESNLFPEWQKYMTEFIALASNAGQKILVTTHSPYVLGTMNNLIFAAQLSNKHKDVTKIIPTEYFIHEPSAYFVNKGLVSSCIDEETGLVQNELVDAISDQANSDLESLLDIEFADAE